VEPIQGEGGVLQAQASFLKFLRTWCDKNKAVLIFDEIQTGVGRTGTLWNYEQCGITPDIMTLAKPLGGGLPLGATLCTKEIAKAISIGNHGTTFGGNPVACAAGLAVMQTVSKKSFLSNVTKNGNYCVKKLQALKKDLPSIKDIRGCGLMIGVELDSDPSDIVAACKKEGLLVVKAGHHTIRLLPPLTITRIDIDNALEILYKVLKRN
jgi:acetylornithine/succinyldiaminopimelate/putrescine aminotransferase